MSDDRIENRGSKAARRLETAWDMLRVRTPGLPPAVMVVIASPRGRKLGHFAPHTWRADPGANAHEIAISPALFDSAEALLATLAHEAAHAVLFGKFSARHVGGVSRDGYYHRKEFRDTCREVFSLDCQFVNTRRGWSQTAWPASGVPERYRSIVKYLKRAMPFGTGGFARVLRPGRPTPRSGHTRLAFRCDRPRSIYVRNSAMREGGIVCRLCASEFLPSCGESTLS